MKTLKNIVLATATAGLLGLSGCTAKSYDHFTGTEREVMYSSKADQPAVEITEKIRTYKRDLDDTLEASSKKIAGFKAKVAVELRDEGRQVGTLFGESDSPDYSRWTNIEFATLNSVANIPPAFRATAEEELKDAIKRFGTSTYKVSDITSNFVDGNCDGQHPTDKKQKLQ